MDRSRARRRSALVAVCVALTGLAASACGDDPPEPEPEPQAARTTPDPTGDATGDATGEATGDPTPPAAEGASLGTPSTVPVPVEPGTYTIPAGGWSVADVTVDVPAGWTVQYGHILAKNADREGELAVYPVLVDEVYADACGPDESQVAVGPDPLDLLDALAAEPALRVGPPVETTVGDGPATRVDVQVARGVDLGECRLAQAGVLGLQVWFSRPADKYFVLGSDSMARVYVLDLDGRRQVFLVQVARTSSTADVAELEGVLASIRLGEPV